MKHRITAMLTLCVLLCSTVLWAIPVQGATSSASITVEYLYDEAPVENVEIDIYLIATWTNGAFLLTEEFDQLGIDFDDLTSPSDWREEGDTVEDYIHDESCDCDDCQHTDQSGTALFNNLTYGIYYVDVADTPFEDGNLISSPVLLTLPSYDTSTNSYTYDIVMEPKVVYVEEPDVPETPTTPSDPDDPDDPDEPEIPEIPEIPAIPEEPDDPDKPKTPDIPHDPYDPDDPDEPLFGIPDPDVPRDNWEFELPQTGTNAWLIVPLATVGLGLLLFALFAGRGKKRRP